MKKIILIRHGKSSWDLDVRDYDRVLQQRGIDDGHLIGKTLKELSIKVDAVYSSTAARALQTATIVTEYLEYSLNLLKLDRGLYTFDGRDLIDYIHGLDDQFNTVILFSHNHGLTETANKLGSTYFDNVPTTGVVAIDFSTKTWKEAEKGITGFNLFPKNLK